MRSCPQCGGEVEVEHRFCLWCATPQRLKLVRFFSPYPGIAADRGKMLRVSYYVGAPTGEQRVRFSVWNEEGIAEAAISLSRAGARRLAGFVNNPCGAPSRLSGILAHVRADVEQAFSWDR